MGIVDNLQRSMYLNNKKKIEIIPLREKNSIKFLICLFLGGVSDLQLTNFVYNKFQLVV